jgi:NADH-quinone oxidoreductase subunit M
VSHMGFVLIGVFAWNRLALQGVILQIVCHAFSTGGLFILVGSLEERLGTRDMDRMGGLWAVLPRFGGTSLVLALAALGLPGLGNFVAEFLILLGVWRVSPPAAILGALGLVFATVYALWMIQRVFHGRLRPAEPDGSEAQAPRTIAPAATGLLPGAAAGPSGRDLDAREIAMMAVSILVILWLGLYPQTFLRTAGQTVDSLQKLAPPRAQAQVHGVAAENTGLAPALAAGAAPAADRGRAVPGANAVSAATGSEGSR